MPLPRFHNAFQSWVTDSKWTGSGKKFYTPQTSHCTLFLPVGAVSPILIANYLFTGICLGFKYNFQV